MGEGGRRPDEGTFVATISNVYSFIQEPSPALSGTLSHPASQNGRGRMLQQSPKETLFSVGVGPVEFAGFGGDGAGLQGALFDGGDRHDLAVIPG